MPRRRRTNLTDYPRDAGTAARISAVAASTSRRYGLSAAGDRWRSHTVSAANLRDDTPVLALDDYSRIPFVEAVVGAAWYQYRSRLRCADGDCYAVARPAIDGYEEYNRRFLGLGRARLIRLEPSSSSLALARILASDGGAFDRLVTLARDGGGLLLHPYMAIEPVWELAGALEEAAGVPVRVLGPLPAVTRLANDKARFSAIVERLLGGEALARTATSADPRVVAELVREFATRYDSLALKMPSCVSGMGNRIFDGRRLRGKPLRAFRSLVDRFLENKEWDGRQELLVVQWHRDVLESPSTQCWIPPLDGGEPRIDEVYQQILVGEERVFEGAMLSALPAAIRHDFMVKSWLVCRVLQQLGYVGRCSFDGLVVGRHLEDARVKFVECNGRWGGTSTPMHLMTRVFGDFRSIPYRAQDYVDERLRGLEFGHLLELFGDTLYDRRTGKGRVLLYNVGGITEHGKFDVVVTGRTYAEIGRFIDRRIPALIERYTGSRALETDRRPHTAAAASTSRSRRA
jgi:hypothetical protein